MQVRSAEDSRSVPASARPETSPLRLCPVWASARCMELAEGLPAGTTAGHESPRGQGRWQAENGAWLPVLLGAFTGLSASGKDPETSSLCSCVSSCFLPPSHPAFTPGQGQASGQKVL